MNGNLVFVLLAPLSVLEFFAAFVAAAVVRGLLVGLVVYAVAVWFVNLPLHHPAIVLVFGVLSSAALGTLGLIAGIWADKYDQLAGFQNFVILPLSFLSGVFYRWVSLRFFRPVRRRARGELCIRRSICVVNQRLMPHNAGQGLQNTRLSAMLSGL